MRITGTGLDPDYEKVISYICNGIYFMAAVTITHDDGSSKFRVSIVLNATS